MLTVRRASARLCSNDKGIDNLCHTTIRMSSHLRPISQLFSVFVALYL